jgi:hypothetical protein
LGRGRVFALWVLRLLVIRMVGYLVETPPHG